MSRDASVTLDWADGEHHFRLGWGEIAKLQEAVDAGPYYLLQQIYAGHWRVEHLSNIIRLGLVGGGMVPVDALKLVRSYVESRPPMENLQTAIAILAAGCMGAPDEEIVKKKRKPATGSMTSRAARSDSAKSTGPAQP